MIFTQKYPRNPYNARPFLNTLRKNLHPDTTLSKTKDRNRNRHFFFTLTRTLTYTPKKNPQHSVSQQTNGKSKTKKKKFFLESKNLDSWVLVRIWQKRVLDSERVRADLSSGAFFSPEYTGVRRPTTETVAVSTAENRQVASLSKTENQKKIK